MAEEMIRTGGCLCRAVRYEARGEPLYAGLCFCEDCRKASGSGFIPFMGFSAASVSIQGEVRQSRTPSFTGGEAVRNHCAACGGLVFGGERGKDDEHTLYAGSLDDASTFQPKIAVFTRTRPAWAVVPEGVASFETLPPRA